MLGPGHQDGLEWRDRFYLEQRAGGWISAGRQGFDLTGRRMVLPANCFALLSDALSLPAPLRARAVLEEAFVRHLAPDLANHPYNPGSKKEQRKARRAAKAGGADAGRTGFVSRLRRAVRRRAG